MRLGTFNTGIGAELVVADFLDWEIIFAHAQDHLIHKILVNHYPGVFVSQNQLPNNNVEIFSGRTAGPPNSPFRSKRKLNGNNVELALQFFNYADKLAPQWILWETTPNWLSKDQKGFEAILKCLEEFGYGFAYRVLDSKYFGVPQSRRTLYLIGYRGDWRPPATVLFDEITRGIYQKESGEKPNYLTRFEELADEDFVILPHKISNSSLLRVCKKLQYLKDKNIRYNQSNDLLLISNLTKEVRELTPIEWERLQGYMDNYTEKYSVEVQPLSNKQRYALVGSAGCVPVYLWIYWRLGQVQKYLLNTRSE